MAANEWAANEQAAHGLDGNGAFRKYLNSRAIFRLRLQLDKKTRWIYTRFN